MWLYADEWIRALDMLETPLPYQWFEPILYIDILTFEYLLTMTVFPEHSSILARLKGQSHGDERAHGVPAERWRTRWRGDTHDGIQNRC